MVSPATGGETDDQTTDLLGNTPGRTPLYRSILPEGPGALKPRWRLVVNKIR